MPRMILYCDEVSPPCRAVLLAGEAIGVPFEIREVNLMKGETLASDFAKINPQHTIPTLDDNGFILWDSHAIITYLAEKFDKTEKIYPKDLQLRGLVEQRLFFDSGTLYPNLNVFTRCLLIKKEKSVQDKIKFLIDNYEFMEQFLKGRKWLAGDDHYTLADISCATTLSSLEVFHPFSQHPNIDRWLKTCQKELPGYEHLNTPGNKKFHDIFLPLLSQG